MTIETHSPEETFSCAAELAAKASPGSVYALSGDLGCGKTVFSQGFAEGLGVKDKVTSPTFTIMQQYTEGRLPLYHFDLYRIGEAEELYEIGFDEYVNGSGVCLVEWADLFPECIPHDAVRIDIRKDLLKGDDYRLITVS
ncbi:MAG: tRNA (adenosine(37)-N6)-threonylcarbamoyltransferase complex ATPase subunit type 1 TsaE [Lachnospiraceae bacterium]|nr:tRNA (adenosine(37)-N6)-threonylcarbamoyltransferase complex ATPase subunit type 1 TsaE [Lachnospiraceae bacterium]